MSLNQEEIPEMARIVGRNIDALLHHKKAEMEKRTLPEKAVDHIINFISSMQSLYFHLIFFGCWIVWNAGWLPVKIFDPQFFFLDATVAIEAILLTTCVLIGQKRMKLQADKSAELGLQVSLLTEHEVTRIMTLVTAIAKKMDIQEAHDEEIEELSKDIHPEKVLDTIEKASV